MALEAANQSFDKKALHEGGRSSNILQLSIKEFHSKIWYAMFFFFFDLHEMECSGRKQEANIPEHIISW